MPGLSGRFWSYCCTGSNNRGLRFSDWNLGALPDVKTEAGRGVLSFFINFSGKYGLGVLTKLSGTFIIIKIVK
jgi:hypothetical protein